MQKAALSAKDLEICKLKEGDTTNSSDHIEELSTLKDRLDSESQDKLNLYKKYQKVLVDSVPLSIAEALRKQVEELEKAVKKLTDERNDLKFSSKGKVKSYGSSPVQIPKSRRKKKTSRYRPSFKCKDDSFNDSFADKFPDDRERD